MWSESIGWRLFAAFATLYFVLRSPVLGAVDTIAGLTVGLVSLACISRLDRTAAVLADDTLLELLSVLQALFAV